MNNIFISWIMTQLILVGGISGHTLWQIENNQYDCSRQTEEISINQATFVSAAVPLIFFMNNAMGEKINEYCQSTPKTSATSTKQ